MTEKAFFGQSFVFCSRSSVIAIRINADAASRSEDSCHFDILRGHQLDQVFHDDVDTVFMESAVAAEAEQV